MPESPRATPNTTATDFMSFPDTIAVYGLRSLLRRRAPDGQALTNDSIDHPRLFDAGESLVQALKGKAQLFMVDA